VTQNGNERAELWLEDFMTEFLGTFLSNLATLVTFEINYDLF